MLWRLLQAVLPRRPAEQRQIARALELRAQGNLPAAERHLRQTLAGFPRSAAAATNLAIVLLEQARAEQGVALLYHAIDCDPQCAAAHYNLANVLRSSGRLTDAIAGYRMASNASGSIPSAREELMHTLLEVCDWDGADAEASQLRTRIVETPDDEWLHGISPLTAAYLELSPQLRCRLARYHATASAYKGRPLHRRGLSANKGRLRVAYLSRDFRDHPVGHLMRTAFAMHDRSRFEVFLYSSGPDDGSVYRRDIASGADHFVDIAGMPDADAARAIAAAGIHVLIDLGGHTTGNRLGVLAYRPAPVQAHYLGYPGTTGAPYVDYFITDAVATPEAMAHEFTEQLACMPDSFMLTNGMDAHAAAQISRASQGLPEQAFVLSCFTNSSRITRTVFGLWMEMLREAPSAVLWLKRSDLLTVSHLHAAARRCDIDPQRILFAGRLARKEDHMARLALADLALDTIGWYNGHSNTSDMLWAGVPVLTTPGVTFASRVAASVLSAAGMPELIARDAGDYVAKAVRLARNPGQCAALRGRLGERRHTAPFFDTGRTVSALERLYRQMWNSFSRGELPHRLHA